MTGANDPLASDIERAQVRLAEVKEGLAALDRHREAIRTQRVAIGHMLQDARTRLNLQATAVARGAGVDLGNLRNVELGRRNFHLPLVHKVLTYLHGQAETQRADSP